MAEGALVKGRAEIEAASVAVGVARELLRSHEAAFNRFAQPRAEYEDAEERAAAALLGPIFSAARTFVGVHDAQTRRALQSIDQMKRTGARR